MSDANAAGVALGAEKHAIYAGNREGPGIQASSLVHSRVEARTRMVT